MEISPRPQTDVKTMSSPRSTSAAAVTEAQVLIEGNFVELDSQLRFVRDVHIFVSGEFVYVKEQRNGREVKLTHLLQHGSGKVLNKFRRSDVTIRVKEDCFRTFKAKWETEDEQWKIYRMCNGNDAASWSKWLRFFGVIQHTSPQRVPSLAVDEDFSDSSSEGESSEEEDEDILAVPFRPLTLSVDRAISTWSMSMLNPSTVRKLTLSTAAPSSLGTIGSENEDSNYALDLESLFRSNSIPKLAQARSYRSPSLPDVSELKVTCVDTNRWRSPENLKPNSDQPSDLCSTSPASEGDNQQAGTELAEQPSKDVVLQRRIESLRAETSNLNFVRKGRGSETTWDILMSPYNRRFSLSVAMNNEANRIPLEDESSLGDSKSPQSETSDSHSVCSLSSSNTSEQLKMVARQLNFDDDDLAGSIRETDQKTQPAFRRIWTRLSKRRPKSRSETSWSPNHSKPNQGESTKQEGKKSKSKEDLSTPKLTGYVVANIRRGGVCNNISGRKEGVHLSHVTKAGSIEDVHPPPSPVHNKPELPTEVTPVRKISTVSTGSTKKKLVQKILSPIFKSGSMDDSVVLRRASFSGDVSLSSEFVRASTGAELPQRLVDIDAMTFAREITLIDKLLLIKISWEEVATCGWMTKDKHLRSPNVMAMVEFFNRIALLVASEILSESSPVLRAEVIARVIQIADKCRRLRNYNSLKALLAGLQSTPIYRLQESWKEVPSKRKKKFRELSLLMTEDDNFAAYRAELDSLPGPCIPFLGNVLTQIAQVQAYASIRRKRQKRLKEPSSPVRKVSTDEVDGTRQNGVTKCNGSVGHQGEQTPPPPPPRPISPRDMYKRHSKKEPQDKSRDRTPKSASRIPKNPRRYGRYSSDTGIIGTRMQTTSNEQLAAPVDTLDRTLNLSRSDSVIANTFALEEEEGQSSPALARPSLSRRLSESGSSAGKINGKSRRLSEAGRPTSFIKNLMRRSQSSHSVKDGNLSRKASSERLSVSACNMKDEYVLSREALERLRAARSNPSVRNGPAGMSRDQLPGEVAQGFEQSLSTKSSETSTASSSSSSGIEHQLWKYQLAAIEYEFPTQPGVKQFLLNANFNTEEDNYRLSLKREEPIKTS